MSIGKCKTINFRYITRNGSSWRDIKKFHSRHFVLNQENFNNCCHSHDTINSTYAVSLCGKTEQQIQ